MIVTIHGTGIELNDAIKEYVEEKILGLAKFYNNITQARVDVGRTTHHHQKGKIFYAEVNLHLPRKMLRVVKEATDLYKAIDKVKDHLKLELEKTKEKRRAKDKKMLRGKKEYQG